MHIIPPQSRRLENSKNIHRRDENSHQWGPGGQKKGEKKQERLNSECQDMARWGK